MSTVSAHLNLKSLDINTDLGGSCPGRNVEENHLYALLCPKTLRHQTALNPVPVHIKLLSRSGSHTLGSILAHQRIT